MALLPIAIKAIHPLRDNILVTDMAFDERKTASGIVILNDDMKSTGIRPRWAKVYAIGPDQKDVTVGQWICIEHGRWTRGIKVDVPELGAITLHKIDNNAIMLVSDEPVNDYTMSDKATG